MRRGKRGKTEEEEEGALVIGDGKGVEGRAQ